MAFVDGASLPASTDTGFMGAVSSFFYGPVVNTLFQSRVINIALAIASIFIVTYAVRALWKKFHAPARGGGFSGLTSSEYMGYTKKRARALGRSTKYMTMRMRRRYRRRLRRKNRDNRPLSSYDQREAKAARGMTLAQYMRR